MTETRSARIGVTQVQALQPGEILRDTEVKGFGVRRRADAVSYFLQTRVKGRLRWFTIGKHGAPWTPATARKEALRLLATVSQGKDPGADKKRALRTRTLADAAKIDASIDQFLDRIVEADNPSIISAYEAKIAKLNRTFHLDLLEKPGQTRDLSDFGTMSVSM